MKQLKVILVAALLSASFAARAQEQQKTSYDFSAWFVLNGFQDRGGFDSRELPRYVVSENVAPAAAPAGTTVKPEYNGYAVRQSRLRFGFTAPTDNFLGGTTMKGLLEADFYGGAPVAVSAAGAASQTGTVDTVVPRLRHAYMSATWKDAANLTLLVGQTWGVAIAQPSGFAASLAHLAVPRFGGAGFLYRRAPQIRLSADLPAGPLSVYVAGAALTAGDLSSNQSNSPGGNQSTIPNLEGRVAAKYAQQGPVKAEVGFNLHYGQERWTTNPAAGSNAPFKAVTATSQMYGVDAKIDVAMVTLVGGLWQGQNLDNWNSISGLAIAGAPASNVGVLFDTTNPADPKAYEVKTQGAWAQLQVTPVSGLQVLAGLGFENPKDSTLALPGATVANNMILRNEQLSGGVVWSVTSKWRVSFEATRFNTTVKTAAGSDTLGGNQFEIGSLLAL
jgi:hypothetical protein